MTSEGRRCFLRRLGAGAIVLAGAPACRRAPDRDAALRSLVQDVAVPDASALVGTSTALGTAVERFCSDPSRKSLADAQAAFRVAALTWKRAYCFRNGPLVETSALIRSQFWPPSWSYIDQLVAGSEPLDVARLESLGVDQKGLYAVEALLFGPDPEGAVASFEGVRGARRGRLLALYTDDVKRNAARVAAGLGDGHVYAATFASAGQESVNRIVNQMIESTEAVAAERLDRVLGFAANGLLRREEIEGLPSRTSKDLASALVVGTERLYTRPVGQTLSALVAHSAPALDARILSAFTEARRALDALLGPLEVAAVHDRALLERARDAAKALERTLKTDLVTALGVTITFTSSDGD